MLNLYTHLHSLHPWIILRLLVPIWPGLVLYIHSRDFWCCSTHLGDSYPTYTRHSISPLSNPISQLKGLLLTRYRLKGFSMCTCTHLSTRLTSIVGAMDSSQYIDPLASSMSLNP